ncbi:MAG: GPW/gp25 family protein [Methylophagaceae bacterium]|jgi:phage baseplate assembly protein W|tara:strand:- start:18000 stop:18416 length:417 start_codon:yes stop_codon:yes gene_type:complete
MTVDVFTPRTKKVNLYSDFHKDLRVSPISKDLALMKDEDAVKQSIKNLMLTDPGERLMQPNIGGGIRQLLFEQMTPGTLKLMEENIVDTIEIYEPRAELIDVRVIAGLDDTHVNISVLFSVRNEEQPIQLDVILDRTR